MGEKDNQRKKVKRDMKMKHIHNSCSCRIKIKRNEDVCKNSHLLGRTNEEVFVVACEEDRCSDSKQMIKRSNKRSMEKGGSTICSSGPFLSLQILEEAEVTKLIGNVIRFNMEDFQNQAKDAVESLGEQFFQ